MSTDKKPTAGVLTGAAFLMAVSAIGPGFLSQTTLFTAQLGASLGCAILLSIFIDIGAQLNTWRVICVSGRRGQEVADAVVPGLRWVVVAVILVGSFIFNLGNLGGCALALDALLGIPQGVGATLSATVGVVLFLLPRMLSGMDWFSKVLGVAMILMTLYVLFRAGTPLGEAALRSVSPEKIDPGAIVTLVGGTVGGYIMFSGAHRLLDGGIRGENQVAAITWASVQGILITGVMRVVLFLAVLGVVQTGAPLSKETPVFDAFQAGAGKVGFVLSTLVFWAAAITSVVGCAYTSISFVKPEGNERLEARLIVGFIVASWLGTVLFQAAGWEATPLLIAAGRINGILLPILLGVVLIAAQRPSLMGEYRHPPWATALGVLAWLATLGMACYYLLITFG